MKKTLLIAAIFLCGCSKSPFDRTKDASNGGAAGTFGAAGSFVIFNNELVSGGGAFLYPGGEHQSLSFNDTTNSISRRSIRYSWTGEDVSAPGCNPDPEHTFAGFDLMHTAVQGDYDSTPARDLRAAGYTRVTFFARGSLSSRTVMKVEAASPGNPAGCPVPIASPCITLSANGTDDDPNYPCGRTAQLTDGWQTYSIPLANSNLASIKDFIKGTFVFEPLFVGSSAPGQGGTVYFDGIQYQP